VDYVREVDTNALTVFGRIARTTLLGPESGAQGCVVSYNEIPPGDAGAGPYRTHPFQQNVYVVQGVMAFLIEGQRYEAPAGSLVAIPPGFPQNWASGTDPARFLGIEVPGPQPGALAVVPVEEPDIQ
jgi:quercetin dioxygenase-like cupin family protein